MASQYLKVICNEINSTGRNKGDFWRNNVKNTDIYLVYLVKLIPPK